MNRSRLCLLGALVLALPAPAPAQILPAQGLVLHLDASHPLRAGAMPAGSVALWEDLAPGHHDVTQPDNAHQPKLVKEAAGLAHVQFVGAEWLDGPPVLPEGGKQTTLVAVWRREDKTGSVVVMEQAAPGPGRRAALLSGEAAYGFNGEMNDQHALLPWVLGQRMVSVVRLSPDGLVTLFHNGFARAGRIDPEIEKFGAERVRVGAKIANGLERFTGGISELMIYDRPLSDAEAQSLTTLLERKWHVSPQKGDPESVAFEAALRKNEADPNRYHEPYRPQTHFTPIFGWMNDPNGLVYFRGVWHMFYQYHSWGHAISKDLVHWKHLPPAIRPDANGEIWSGSAVIDWHDSSGFFGGKPGMVCVYTSMNPADGGRQAQSIAYSPDGIHFKVYARNPVIPELRFQAGQHDEVDFRDPKVFWHEPTKRWIMAVAGGTLRFYSSTNLREWTLESTNQDINTECPDFFEMPVVGGSPSETRWLLSAGGKWYVTGKFDGHHFTPDGPRLPMNYGKDCYASQTWNETPDHRRILIAWLYSWGYQNVPTAPWSGGGMTLPYQLTLHKTPDGPRLRQMPIAETEKLRGKPTVVGPMDLTPGVNALAAVRGKALEVEAEFEVGSAKSIVFRVPAVGPHAVTFGYDVASGKLFTDRREAGFAELGGFTERYDVPLAATAGRVKLRFWLDANSLELFDAAGATPMTTMILPDPSADTISLQSQGGDARIVSLRCWPLKRIW